MGSAGTGGDTGPRKIGHMKDFGFVFGSRESDEQCDWVCSLERSLWLLCKCRSGREWIWGDYPLKKLDVEKRVVRLMLEEC